MVRHCRPRRGRARLEGQWRTRPGGGTGEHHRATITVAAVAPVLGHGAVHGVHLAPLPLVRHGMRRMGWAGTQGNGRLSANDNQATTGLRFAPSHARGARRRHAGPLCRRRRLYKRGPPHLLQPRCHCRQTERGQCVPLPQRAVGGCGCTARPWPGVMNCRAMRITTSFAGRSVFPSGSSARSRTVGASRRG